MNNKAGYIENLYSKRNEFLLIGLTGRTGAGCTTTAGILSKKEFADLDLKSYKTCDYNNADERKYSYIYRFIKEGKKWKGFDVIEASTIIFSFLLEGTYSELFDFIDSFTEKGILNAEIDELKNTLYQKLSNKRDSYKDVQKKVANQPINKLVTKYINDLQVENSRTDYEKISSFFMTNAKIIKNEIKKVLEKYRFELHRKKDDEEAVVYNFYVYFMQVLGNNLRSSGKYNDSRIEAGNETIVAKRIEKIITAIVKSNQKKNDNRTRICIDALRNSVEIHYFRDQYRAFYLFAVNTEDIDRQNRLGLSKKEMEGLDKVEYPDNNDFYHQNIQACIEIADVYLYNPNSSDHKNFVLTEQVLKYIALILQPGLVAPTHLERCMQLAFNAKYNSGCLSRKVGAVVTGEDYSIRSVGWNDVPKGQVACNLRCVQDYCRNKDIETFSEFELTDELFSKKMEGINGRLLALQDENPLRGKYFSYCFKDVHNCKNQVFTRSLHAEENAFLQIAKYGGAPIQGGKLFTTASPCELCSKKAYQLGIKEIYYIDPYPGIAQKHILSFGKSHNPQMRFFQGAIGNAYISMYSSRLPYKDELGMLTGIKVKEVVEEIKKEFDEKNN